MLPTQGLVKEPASARLNHLPMTEPTKACVINLVDGCTSDQMVMYVFSQARQAAGAGNSSPVAQSKPSGGAGKRKADSPADGASNKKVCFHVTSSIAVKNSRFMSLARRDKLRVQEMPVLRRIRAEVRGPFNPAILKILPTSRWVSDICSVIVPRP